MDELTDNLLIYLPACLLIAFILQVWPEACMMLEDFVPAEAIRKGSRCGVSSSVLCRATTSRHWKRLV